MAGTNKKLDKAIDDFSKVLTNKRSRSFFFLILSFLVILGINSLLPTIQGASHYTADVANMTYAEYLVLKESDVHYEMTWLTEQKIEDYKKDYIEANPELTVIDKALIEVPGEFPVKVYTKFFFEYTFWYISTLTSLISAVLLFYSLFNYLLTISKDKYKKYVELEQDLEKMSRCDLDPVTFEPWMDYVFNYKRKIKQHKGNVKYKLDLLEQKTKYEDKKRLKNYFKQPNDGMKEQVLAQLGELTKKELKYLTEKERLLSYLDEDYIKEYVVNGRVKYFKYIHPMFVYTGTNTIGKTVDSYSLIKSDAQKISNDAGVKVLFSLTLTFIFSILFTVTAIASAEQSVFWIIVNVIAKIAPLLMQIPLAINYNNAFMENQLLQNLSHRRSIGLTYLADINRGVNIKDPDERFLETIKEVPTNAEEDKSRIRQTDHDGSGDGTQE